MVAALGGILDIASKPGEGTKVTVTLPGGLRTKDEGKWA
jgi:signal transduction histidine kinase